MTRETLEEQIKKKADADVQKSIAAIKRGVHELLCKHGVQGSWYDGSRISLRGEAMTVLQILLSEKSTTGWPSGLWRRREAQLIEEVLGTMDTLQQVLAAADVTEIHGEPEAEPLPTEQKAG